MKVFKGLRVKLTGVASSILLSFAGLAVAQAPTDLEDPVLVENVDLVDEERTRLEAYLDAAVRAEMTTNDYVGMTVSIVRDGELILLKGYGFADLEEQVPVDPSYHMFRIGSVTKPFTYTALMQLVEQGKVDLDADVNDYLSAFKIPERFGEPILVKDLFTHRPGFEEAFRGMWGRDDSTFISLEDWLAQNTPGRVLEPGKYSSYSNYGASLAGYIVEQVSGTLAEQYIKENILGPLGMASTSMGQLVSADNPRAMPDEIRDQVAKTYSFAGGYPKLHHFELVVPAPAGSMSATAEDMTKFMLAHLGEGENGGARILTEETALLMRERPYQDRVAADYAHGFRTGELLGFQTFEHGGATMTSYSSMVMVPELEIGVFVSTNGGKDALGPTRIADSVISSLIGEKARPPRQAVELSADDLKPYTGAYLSTRRVYDGFVKFLMAPSLGTNVSVTPRNTLLVQAGGASTELTPLGDHLFVEQSTGALTNFVMDENGQASALVSSYGHTTMMRMTANTNSQGFFIALGFLGLLALTHLTSAWKRRGETVPDHAWARRLPLATFVTSILVLVSIFCLAWVLAEVASGGIEVFIYHWPLTSVTLLFLSILVLLAATIVLAAGLVPAFTTPEFSIWRKVHYALLVVALIYFLIQANHWNMVGFKYW